MKRTASTVASYLSGLPPDRRREIEAVRRVILDHLPAGYEETVDFGMLAYVVPLSVLPDTYNGHPLPVAALAAQKRHMSLYLMGVYGDPATKAWFEAAYHATGKRLDMGKACVRFRRAEDLPLDVVGRTIAKLPLDVYVGLYRRSRAGATPTPKAGTTSPRAGGARRATAPSARCRRS